MDLREELLQDAKLEEEIRKKYDPEDKAENPFHRVMLSYAYFLDDKKESDYENRDLAKSIYSSLGWNNQSYDIINSFYTTYTCGLTYYCKKMGRKLFGDDPFLINDDGIFKTRMKLDGIVTHVNLSKLKFSEKMIGQTVYRDFSDEMRKECSIFESFAARCHCVANFMPCPPPPFNEAKGCLREVRDYLPLMIDKIQKLIDKGEDMKYTNKTEEKTIPYDEINKWHQWFSDNRVKYSLEPYYEVKKEGKKTRIIGLPFFGAQSLEHPLPESYEEVKECLNEMMDRINRRADLIVGKVQSGVGHNGYILGC